MMSPATSRASTSVRSTASASTLCVNTSASRRNHSSTKWRGWSRSDLLAFFVLYKSDGHLSCQDWVTIGDDKYKFIQTWYGVTRQEAQDICAGNGGFLATIENEEKRVALQNYYKKNVATQTKNYFLAALDFFSGSGSTEVKRAYWVGASDQAREGAWTWDGSGRNVSDSAWFFFGRGIPGEVEQFNEFGDDDCAIIFDKENILR